MASAQLLELPDAIDNEVREITGNVLVVDDRVARVDDRVRAAIDSAQYIYSINHLKLSSS